MGIGYAQFLGLFGLQYTGQVKATNARYRELIELPTNREHLLNLSNNVLPRAFCLPRQRQAR